MSKITIKKVAQGKYKAYRDKELMATAIFTPKYYPAPFLSKGFEVSIKVKGHKPIKQIVRNIMEGRQKLLKEVNRR